MPSHKIHLSIAYDINKHLKTNLDSLMIGSVLPDLVENTSHTKSHYQNGKLGVSGTANPDKFIEKNKEKLNDSIYIGYLIHILTDKFYNTYFFTNFFIYDDEENDIGLRFKNKEKFMNPSKIKYYKQRDLAIFDKWLLRHRRVYKFKSDTCVENVEVIDEFKFDKSRLKKYIKNANKDISGLTFLKHLDFRKYKLTDKNSMQKIYDECINYILEYLRREKLL